MARTPNRPRTRFEMMAEAGRRMTPPGRRAQSGRNAGPNNTARPTRGGRTNPGVAFLQRGMNPSNARPVRGQRAARPRRTPNA